MRPGRWDWPGRWSADLPTSRRRIVACPPRASKMVGGAHPTTGGSSRRSESGSAGRARGMEDRRGGLWTGAAGVAVAGSGPRAGVGGRGHDRPRGPTSGRDRAGSWLGGDGGGAFCPEHDGPLHGAGARRGCRGARGRRRRPTRRRAARAATPIPRPTRPDGGSRPSPRTGATRPTPASASKAPGQGLAHHVRVGGRMGPRSSRGSVDRKSGTGGRRLRPSGTLS